MHNDVWNLNRFEALKKSQNKKLKPSFTILETFEKIDFRQKLDSKTSVAYASYVKMMYLNEKCYTLQKNKKKSVLKKKTLLPGHSRFT